MGVVLAGGRSERMGRDKALLPWPLPDGRLGTFVERAARALEPLCETVEIAEGAPGRIPNIAWDRFPDAAPDQGPLAAIVAALDRAAELEADAIVALACDMPLAGPDELRPLVEAAFPAEPGASPRPDAAMWVVDGRDQPLCALYRADCRAAARRAFEAGERRVVAMFEPTAAFGRRRGLVRLTAGEKSARRLVNVNTATDYDRALRLAAQER
ncbi:MAG: molybdenum cofactor guanylyltransferase [Planctomycetota bacterium]